MNKFFIALALTFAPIFAHADATCSHFGPLPWPMGALRKVPEGIEVTGPYGTYRFVQRYWETISTRTVASSDGFILVNRVFEENVPWTSVALPNIKSAEFMFDRTDGLKFRIDGKELASKKRVQGTGILGFYPHPNDPQTIFFMPATCTVMECPCGYPNRDGVYRLDLKSGSVDLAYGEWNGLSSNAVRTMLIDGPDSWFITSTGVCRLREEEKLAQCWNVRSLSAPSDTPLELLGGGFNKGLYPLSGARLDDSSILGVRGGFFEPQGWGFGNPMLAFTATIDLNGKPTEVVAFSEIKPSMTLRMMPSR